MLYDELVMRVKEVFERPEYTVNWSAEAEPSEVDYTIVPVGDGRFALYRPTGRGEIRPDVDSAGRPRMFSSEDAVCDYVWAKLTEPPPPIPTVHLPSAEELADQRRARRARRAARGIAAPDSAP
jgi:hypothetical protein